MAAMKLPSSMPQRLELAGWSLWLPLEGEGTGVDRWPLQVPAAGRQRAQHRRDHHHHRVPAARASWDSASAGAEIRTRPDLRVICLRLPTPTFTDVRCGPKRQPQRARAPRYWQTPGEPGPSYRRGQYECLDCPQLLEGGERKLTPWPIRLSRQIRVAAGVRLRHH